MIKNLTKRLLLLLPIISSMHAMELPVPRVDANGYQYKDESTIQDKRKIAILSYGSLVRQDTNRQTGAKLEASPFNPTSIQLPISLTRLSQGNRITAVIDRDGDLKRVWAATSRFQYLPNARNNLAAREGANYRNQASGYDLTNIFYMKKLLPGREKESNEETISGSQRWVIRSQANERQRLPLAKAQNLARWADEQGYTAIIWASFPPSNDLSSHADVIRKLLGNSELLSNTQDYVRNLPDGAQSPFERAILAGAQALRSFSSQPQPAISAGIQAAPRPQAQGVPQDRSRHYEQYSYYQRGDLPILLLAPHGGTQEIGVPRRTGRDAQGHRRRQFWTLSDDGTVEIAFKTSDDLNRLLGARPYLVAANFHREYIDANRAPGVNAYESAGAQPIYDFYHGKIRQYIDEIKQRFGNRAILIDIHGQATDARTVFRGTRDRQTVQRLINRDGEASLTGPHSILGILEQKGYPIYPLNEDRRATENENYSGGYTVGAYGSQHDRGIDALQLENGWDLRRRHRDQFSNDLAEAIAGFYEHYLAP